MVFYANAHSLNLASSDPNFQRLLNQADLVYADGIGVAWAGRWLHHCRLEKLTGADWIDHLCRQAASQGWTIYILAGQPGVAARAAEQLEAAYAGFQVVGVADGYFSDKNQHHVFTEINELHPTILFVGLGSPQQELWLSTYRAGIDAPVCWAVGALFDYIAGIEKRAPVWMNAIGMEWFWRLIQNPAGKWKRYLIGNPRFVARVIHQKLKRWG